MSPSALVSQAALPGLPLQPLWRLCALSWPVPLPGLRLGHVSPRHVLASSAHRWPSVVRGVGSSTGKRLGLGKLEGERNGTTSEWQSWDRSSASAATSVAVLTAGHGQLDYMWAAWDPAMWAMGQSVSWEGRCGGPGCAVAFGRESPGAGQPWLHSYSSLVSGQVTKPLWMSAFNTCETGFMQT